MYLIYALLDPVSGKVRYIGQSTVGLLRARQHLMPSRYKRRSHLHVYRWIISLAKINQIPKIVTIEEILSLNKEDLDSAERKWISFYRKTGNRLCNHTDGGEGTLGKKAWNRGIKMSEDFRQKCRMAKLGRSHKKKKLKLLVTESTGNQLCFYGVDKVAEYYGTHFSSVYRAIREARGQKFFANNCKIEQIEE